MTDAESIAAKVDAWLLPVSGEGNPCGPDLERHADFLALEKALAGKPAPQLAQAVAVAPDFRAAQTLAESLLDRSRDLRVAVAWGRAALRTEGIAALPEGLRLLETLLATYPAALRPIADPDPEVGSSPLYARINALAKLPQLDGLMGDLRLTTLLSDRVLGPVRVRAVEIALGSLSPRAGEPTLGRDQLQQFFEASPQSPALRECLQLAQARVRSLAIVLAEQVGDAEVPNFAPLLAMIGSALALLPAAPVPVAETSASEAASARVMEVARVIAAPPAMSGPIRSRDDAVRAIDAICEYFERTEPTNPAPLMLQRAKRMISQSFLELLNDWAPLALPDVAKVMGVDPASVTGPPPEPT